MNPELEHTIIGQKLEQNSFKGHWFKCCPDKNIIDCHTHEKAVKIATLFMDEYFVVIDNKMVYLHQQLEKGVADVTTEAIEDV